MTMVRPDASPEDWRRAVEDQCVVSWLPFDAKDPRGTLLRVIEWNIRIALDPAVSSDAAALEVNAVASYLTSLRNEMEANQSCSVGYFMSRIDEMLQILGETTTVEATFP
ncbi:MAG: hypothetical protein WA045_00465 [Nitrospira sp.]